MNTPTRARPGLDLFVISGTLLFLELACIRWFPAHVMFLTFFTNLVLLACFVGMSAGCLAARRPGRYLAYTPVWIAVAVAAGLLVNNYRESLSTHVEVGDQARPDVVFFGTEASSLARGDLAFTVPVELIAGSFFLLIAAMMVGPGQEMGRAFDRVSSRPRAYTLNLLGSLVGIGLFALCSALHLPPPVWFGVAAVGLAYFLFRKTDLPLTSRPMPRLATVAVLAAGVAATLWTSGLLDQSGAVSRTTWSPYYRIDYVHAKQQIVTNLVAHQHMESRDTRAVAAYSLPYLFQRDVKTDAGQQAWPAFKRVLIIGAGSGNDVSRATQWCPPDARIDAVEIDPVIQNIGARRHPDKPYQDPRVTVHLNDGRNFLRTAPAGEYDLVVFALVDSLVLHSGYSNLRLESYLFTQESFADVRRVLKPTGVTAVYNFFRQGWLVARIRDQLRQAFASNPIVLTDPPEVAVFAERHYGSFTAVFAGGEQAIMPLFKAFERVGNNYWVPYGNVAATDTSSRFAVAPPSLETRREQAGAPHWISMHMAYVPESATDLAPATDDWPFLYARRPAVPAQTWKGVAMTAGLGLVVFLAFGAMRRTPVADRRPAEWGNLARSFLLGAGFMLIETKAVVHMALLFGSTWTVNTVVFAAILVMSLVGSLYAAWRKPTSLVPYYAGLFASLAVNVAVPLSAFLGMNATVQILLSGLMTFAPVAFAGVIFAVTFNRSADPGKLFGANVAGALVGGLAENLSLVLGFRLLGLVAFGFYAASALAGFRGRRAADAAGNGYNVLGSATGPNVIDYRLPAAEPTESRLTQTAPVGEADHGGDIR